MTATAPEARIAPPSLRTLFRLAPEPAAVRYCSKTAGSYRVGAVIKGVYQSSHAKAGAPRKVHCNIWRVDPDAGGCGHPHQNHELARAIVNDTVLFDAARAAALSQSE